MADPVTTTGTAYPPPPCSDAIRSRSITSPGLYRFWFDDPADRDGVYRVYAADIGSIVPAWCVPVSTPNPSEHRPNGPAVGPS